MRANGKAGYALFFVLSLILLLSLLLSGVTRDSRQQMRTAQQALNGAEARAEAEAALSLTIMHLLAAKPDDRWSADVAERGLSLGKAEWRVTITPEDGKVDINRAPPDLLAELFTAAGLPAEEAQRLADRVADWRDDDDLTRLNGAERRAYEDADLPPPRNGPFLNHGEIRRVMGMTEKLYRCIAGAITVHSGKAGIDRRFAPALLKAKRTGSPQERTAATRAAAATSPLAIESSVGRALTIRLSRTGSEHSYGVWAFVIRLTEHGRSSWWLLDQVPISTDRQDGPAKCVSPGHQVSPMEENVTSKG